MKKLLTPLGIIVAIILVLWVVARVTGVLQFYSIPTIANEPAIKQGEHILTSNLIEPVPYKFITFLSRYEDSLNAVYMPDAKNGVHYLHRLCGVPGDIIEMKNGVLFVNNKNFDDELNLKNQFKIKAADFNLIEETDIPVNDEYHQFAQIGDSAIVTFDKAGLKKYQSKIKFIPLIINDTSAAGGSFKWFNKNAAWTADNFGPLKIPANNYFVLGDNRHNAMDSRYTGFINKNDIKGVVLNK